MESGPAGGVDQPGQDSGGRSGRRTGFMSLMRLLLAGRSLNTVKDQPSPYKMKQANLLPKFGSKKADAEAPSPQPSPPPGERDNSATALAVEKGPLLSRWL